VPNPHTSTDLLLAAERGVEAGARMLRQGRSHVGALIAKGDRDFATAVDVAIEEAVKAILAADMPEIPFLGEEEGGAALDQEALWILDPIDGTVNFAHGSPLCGISLALVQDGQPTLAVVDLPLLRERYVAARGAGAFRNGRRIQVSTVDRLAEATVGMSDFAVGAKAETENEAHLELTRALASQALRVRMHGSEAVDLAWLACGRLDATIMLSSLPWDVSGGVLLVREAGGLVYSADGALHVSGSQSTVASTPALREPVVQLVGEAIAAAHQATG
jgi:myo-inositol-1(or 4)-monophosphatase